MRLLEAIDEMSVILAAADAPNRQLHRVQEWRAHVGEAVLAASAYKDPPAMRLDSRRRLCVHGWRMPPHMRFIDGTPTHRAWRDLCRAIINALYTQETYATSVATYWAKAARTAPNPEQTKRALQQQQYATRWRSAACTAADKGRRVIRGEDSIMLPVGLAIRRAGGLDEVALDKHYHQLRARRG